MNLQSDTNTFKGYGSSGTNDTLSWHNNVPVNRNHNQLDAYIGTDDSRKSMECQPIAPANSDVEMKYTNTNVCLDPRPVTSGGDITRFDNYQSVNFVNYLNQSTGINHEVERKIQTNSTYMRRGCAGEDSDQQLSVISEYIEEEEGYADDDEDDDDDNDGGSNDHRKANSAEIANSGNCLERDGPERAEPIREQMPDYHDDIEIDSSPDNSSKTDSEGSKLLIIS